MQMMLYLFAILFQQFNIQKYDMTINVDNVKNSNPVQQSYFWISLELAAFYLYIFSAMVYLFSC